jgi:hypothetical protein
VWLPGVAVSIGYVRWLMQQECVYGSLGWCCVMDAFCGVIRWWWPYGTKLAPLASFRQKLVLSE